MGFGSNQNTSQPLPEILRIRRTWQQNPTDSQSNASSNDDVIDMLITSRRDVTNRRRRTLDNELGMNESQFVSAELVPNSATEELQVETVPRDDPPPPYSEIAQEATTQNIWMSNRQIISQNALTGSIIQQGGSQNTLTGSIIQGGPVLQQGTLGRAVIQAGALGGPIIQQSTLGGAMLQSTLGGTVIQSGAALGGTVSTVIPQMGTNETSFSNVPVETIGTNAANVIRGFIINSGVAGLNVVCENNFQPERTTVPAGPVILNLGIRESEVQCGELPSYEEYLKSQND